MGGQLAGPPSHSGTVLEGADSKLSTSCLLRLLSEGHQYSFEDATQATVDVETSHNLVIAQRRL